MSGYAATEAPAVATSSPEHPELEIADDAVVIEIVDEDGKPVAPVGPAPKVLLTQLDQLRPTADSLRADGLRRGVAAA